MRRIEKHLAIALGEVGYMEKASREQLDDVTANAGSGNFTKYGRDVDQAGYFNGKKQGVEWCAVFVSWCFLQAYGKSMALKLQCQPTKNNAGAGCKSAMNYYKAKGRLVSTPQAGDQVFFGADHANPTHTGLVYSVDNTNIHTIEGNADGAVRKKHYARDHARIAGYGRPDWSLVQKEEKGLEKVVWAQSGSTVNLRASAAASGALVSQVPLGASVTVLSEAEGWAQVAYQDKTGYMMAKFLREEENALRAHLLAAQEALNAAIKEIDANDAIQ